METKLSLHTHYVVTRITFLLLSFLLLTANSFAQGVVEEARAGSSVNYCPDEPCPCRGNYAEIQVYYFGEDNVTVDAYANLGHTILIASFVGVNDGDLLTINGAALVGGTLAYKTYLHITDAMGETCMTKIHTACPSLAWPGSRDDLKILGKTFGDFTVFSRTDSESNFLCDISNVAQDWHVGGNVIGPANNTIGTKNDESMVFITHNNARGTVTNTGDFGINTLNPSARLDVQGDVIVNETLDVNGIARVNDLSSSTMPNNGALIVAGGAGIGENLNVGNDAAIGNDLVVARDALVGRNLNVSVDATIINNLDVGNNGAIGNDLAVAHDAAIANDLTVGRNAQVGQNLDVTDNATIGENLNVGINAAIANDLTVSNNASVGQDLSVGANATVTNDLAVNNNAAVTNNLSVGQNASVGQTLSVADDANIGDDLDVSGDANIDGIVTIGTGNTPSLLGTVNTSSFQLFVDGGILTEEVLVRTGWADYVFEKKYERLSLSQVEQHIEKYGHLPNTPSAKEVSENGLPLGSTAVLQQEKIEELFLYLIEMDKSIKALQAENQALKIQLQSIK